MYKHAHHERIALILKSFDRAILAETGCLFAGGTALSMLLGEYRESLDVDFLVSARTGYRSLREIIWRSGLATILPSLPPVKPPRADRYGVRATVEIDGNPVKIEFVSDDRINIVAGDDRVCGVQTIDRIGFYAQKLLANVDRVNDRSAAGRDAIDLAAMIARWGEIPGDAWQQAEQAYGPGVAREAVGKAVTMFETGDYLRDCLTMLKMVQQDAGWVLSALRRVEISAII